MSVATREEARAAIASGAMADQGSGSRREFQKNAPMAIASDAAERRDRAPGQRADTAAILPVARGGAILLPGDALGQRCRAAVRRPARRRGPRAGRRTRPAAASAPARCSGRPARFRIAGSSRKLVTSATMRTACRPAEILLKRAPSSARKTSRSMTDRGKGEEARRQHDGQMDDDQRECGDQANRQLGHHQRQDGTGSTGC